MLHYRDVHVYRLISKDTVEAAMLAQADRKLELEKQIQRKCQLSTPYLSVIQTTADNTVLSSGLFARMFHH